MIRHLSVSIEYLLSLPKGKLNGFLKDQETGHEFTDAECRLYLLNAFIDDGWRKMPLSADCEGFDHYGKGCPGHPSNNHQTAIK